MMRMMMMMICCRALKMDVAFQQWEYIDHHAARCAEQYSAVLLHLSTVHRSYLTQNADDVCR